MSVGGPQPFELKECLYEPCTRRPERDGLCYQHQPMFVEACANGLHCQCFLEDGRHCCTCLALRPRWRQIGENTWMPLEVMP